MVVMNKTFEYYSYKMDLILKLEVESLSQIMNTKFKVKILVRILKNAI